MLTAIKAELPHGQFLPWIAAEFEMERQTASNFMSVYEKFGDGKFPIIGNFKPTILYALSAPSTPESVIDRAIEQAEAGDKVTAMAYPNPEKRGGRRDRGQSSKNEDCRQISSGNLSMARYVLRNNFTPEGQQYPDRCLAVMAERIQARAITRCGELLKQIEPGHGNRYTVENDATDRLKNRTTAATQAGLSERQKVTGCDPREAPRRVAVLRVVLQLPSCNHFWTTPHRRPVGSLDRLISRFMSQLKTRRMVAVVEWRD